VSADVVYLPVRPGVAELTRLRAIEAAAADLVRYVSEREGCGDRTIRVDAARALRDAVRGESTPGGAA
jgi:hypothetical protein